MALANVLHEELGVHPLTLNDLRKACPQHNVSENIHSFVLSFQEMNFPY